MKIILTSFLFVLVSYSFAQDNNTPVSFTLGDRDQMMRNEQLINSLEKEMNTRFERVDNRFDAQQK